MGAQASNDQVHDLIRGLQDPAAFPHAVQEVQLIETHISWVLLTGEFVYKIKKPVSLGFLDFSTLERRKFFCDEEIRLNRRTAPELYLDVVSIGDTPEGLKIGAEPAVEYAVRMRQFPADARLDQRLKAGLLTPRDMRALAGVLARFHQDLPPRRNIDPASAAARAARPALNNFRPGAFQWRFTPGAGHNRGVDPAAGKEVGACIRSARKQRIYPRMSRRSPPGQSR